MTPSDPLKLRDVVMGGDEPTLASEARFIKSQNANSNKGHTMRPEVKLFAQFMENVLLANDHKGGWQNMTNMELLTKLIGELHELSNAVLTGDRLQMAREAVDMANYAMMLTDNAGEL